MNKLQLQIRLETHEGDLVGQFSPGEIAMRYPGQVVIRNGVARLNAGVKPPDLPPAPAQEARPAPRSGAKGPKRPAAPKKAQAKPAGKGSSSLDQTVRLMNGKGKFAGVYALSELEAQYPGRVSVRHGIATVRTKAKPHGKKPATSREARPAAATAAAARPGAAGPGRPLPPKTPQAKPRESTAPSAPKPKEPSTVPTPRERLAKLGASSNELNYLVRAFEGRDTFRTGKSSQAPTEFFRSVILEAYPDGKLPGAKKIGVDDVVDVLLEADRHSAEGHEHAVEAAYEVVLGAYRNTRKDARREEARKAAELRSRVARGEQARAKAREAAEREEARRKADSKRFAAKRALSGRAYDELAAFFGTRRKSTRPYDDSGHPYEVRTPDGKHFGNYTKREFEFLFKGRAHFKGQEEHKYWEVSFEDVRHIVESATCRYVQAEDGTLATWNDELLKSGAREGGIFQGNLTQRALGPEPVAKAATQQNPSQQKPSQQQERADLRGNVGAGSEQQKAPQSCHSEGKANVEDIAPQKPCSQEKDPEHKTVNGDATPQKPPATKRLVASKEIAGGDVLQVSGSPQRHYVFDLCGTLYIDNAQACGEGDRQCPYGTSLIELSASSLGRWQVVAQSAGETVAEGPEWRVVDRYGKGTVPEGREWYEKYLGDLESNQNS